MTKLTHLSFGGIFLSYIFLFYCIALARNESINDSETSLENDLGNIVEETKIERGKFVSAKVTPEELYDAYQSIRNEYDEKAFLCDNEDMNSPYGTKGSTSSAMKKKCGGKWKILKQNSGIEVAMLHHPSDPNCPYVRMSAILPGPIDDVWDFLRLDNWDKTMPNMDPFYEGLEISKRYSFKNKRKSKPIEMVLARKKTKRLLTFGKRDFTFVQVSDVPRDDGVRVSGTVSVNTDKLPRTRGYTRAFQDSIAFYESVKEGTKVTIVCRIDLNDSSEDGDGGNIPMWIYVKTVGSAGILTIKNMQRELLKELDAKMEEPLMDSHELEIKESDNYAFVSWFTKLKKGDDEKSISKNVSDDFNEHDKKIELTPENGEESSFAPIANLVRWAKSS